MSIDTESRIIARLSPFTAKIHKYPYRPAFILGFFWLTMFGFITATMQTGNRTYFWGAGLGAALAVIGHVVVHMAFSRIVRVIERLMYEVNDEIMKSLVEIEAAKQAVKLAESDLADKN